MSLSENGTFDLILRQALKKNPHILRVYSGFFLKPSSSKVKIPHFRTRSMSALFFYASFFSVSAEAAQDIRARSLADQLVSLRSEVSVLEESLLDGMQSQRGIRIHMKKIQKLLKLQKQERALGQKRLGELEKTIQELESRRSFLNQKLGNQERSIRKSLMAIEASHRSDSMAQFRSFQLPDQEKLEAPRRRVLASLVDRGLKEIETLRADLSDASHLESRIQEEKQQLAYLFQDLREQESVLAFNQQLQLEIWRKKQVERVTQLKNYRKLKTAEAQVEHLIKEFNARRELEKSIEVERKASKILMQGEFAKLKGKLPFPVVGGKVVSQFGRAFDSQSGLYVFKKGVDIQAAKHDGVRAISGGKVAYSGELPNYGKVIIIDHGDHFYSLFGHLGAISKRTSDLVTAGEEIGITSDENTPLYFEIRSRNVAVNPLQWVFN